MAKKSQKKKKKKSFQQEIRDKQPKPVLETESQPVVFKDDLDNGTRIGFVLMSYLLFIVGSIGCVLMGYAGKDKRGSSEVIIIGWSALLIHALFMLTYYSNTQPSIGITPLIPIAILAVFPVICIIAGFAGGSRAWAVVVKTIGLTLLIPNCVVLAMIFPKIAWDEIERKEIQVKNNIYTIQDALENYAYENENQYPDDIQILINEDYLKKLPDNPLFDISTPMVEIDFKSSGKEGNFSYLPVITKGKTVRYYLVGYGANNQELALKPDYYEDIDGDGVHDNVVITIGGSVDDLSDLPPLKEFLE